jgi:4-hydroxy-tetrahydrodipicolinate synthase
MNFQPKGVLPAMITPIDENARINSKALRKLIEHLISGGVHGIFAIGNAGEFYGLDQKKYREVLEITMDQVAGRVPVYAGCNAICTRDAVEYAGIAQELGVAALSVLTPFLVSLNQQEVYNHFADIANSTDLPVLMYNNRPKTAIHIEPKTVQKLAEITNIVGIKDSTGDMTITGEYVRLTQDMDFSVMLGRDTLIYAGLCYGAKGAVASCANVAPKLCVDIYNKFIAGDHKGALEAQYRLAPLRIGFDLASFPAVIKESLNMLGIEAGGCFAPVSSMNDEQKAGLRKILTRMELLQ